MALCTMLKIYLKYKSSSPSSPYPTKWGRHNMFSSFFLFYHSLSLCLLLLLSCHPSHSPSIFFRLTSTRVSINIHTHRPSPISLAFEPFLVPRTLVSCTQIHSSSFKTSANCLSLLVIVPTFQLTIRILTSQTRFIRYTRP
jgi:hypothetical protein